MSIAYPELHVLIILLLLQIVKRKIQKSRLKFAKEELKKPLLNENRIKYWLSSFKSGNVDDEDYQRRVIDTLVNSVYVYDDEDGGKRIS